MNAAEFIASFGKTGARHNDLSRIGKLMDKIGNPQDNLRFVHIAGTNGKGSTLELCSAAMIEAGYKTGQFTSPYVLCYEDRIRINGKNIPQDTLEQLCMRLMNEMPPDGYSRFEITFAIAMLYFSEEKCDIVFLEAGIGGLLDATNIVNNKLACVITSVSLDHTDILGNTIQKIAYQKAGIIRSGCPVIVSCDNENAAVETICKKAGDENAPVIQVKRGDISDVSCTISGVSFSYKSNFYELKMLGKHQAYNACTAIETLFQLNKTGFSVPFEAVCNALRTAAVCARLQIISENPLTIIDGSHNPAGILAFAEMIKSINADHITGVAGMVRTKDYSASAALLNGVFHTAVCVDGFFENNVPAHELSELFTCESYAMNYAAGFEFAKRLALEHGGILAVCGSLYLCSKLGTLDRQSRVT